MTDAERVKELEAKLARMRETLRHDGFDCPACLDPSPDAPHDISDRSCVYGPNSRTATEAKLAVTRAGLADADRGAKRRRMHAARASLAEAREKALREALDFFWDAVAAEDIERAQAGCDCASDACHHQVTVAFDRARAALAAGKETAPK